MVTPTPTRRTWFEIFAMSNKKRTGSIKRKKLWFFGRCAARSSGRPVRILVNNKVIVTDKIDRGCGDVFDSGILCQNKRIRGTANVLEGHIVLF